ncbi:MAG: sulfotransferase [Rhodothermaceae bacterium]|nr:sulfotransferase [Rhodothermaceae bacterium]
MEPLTRQIARKANKTLDQVQGRLKRFIEQENRSKKRELNLTLGRAYEREWEGMKCVFALSTGRTGTQTLAALLRLSPHIVAQHEPAPRLVQASYDAYMDKNSQGWIEKWGPFALATRDDFVLGANAEGKVYVESNNRLTYLADAVKVAFPASKFIFSHRDPYKVIRSGMQRGAYQGPGKAWNFARIRPRPEEPFFDTWESMEPLEKEAWRWARINKEAKDFFDSLPAERKLELPAKAFFGANEKTYKEIFEFVGAPCPTLEEIRQVMGRKMNAQAHFNGLSFEWTEASKDKVRPYIKDVAEGLGYDV